MCRIPQQKTSSAPVVPWHKSDAFQPEVLPQSSDPVEQKSCSTNTALLPVVSSAPSGVEQEVVDVQKNELQKRNSLSKITSIEAQRASAHKPEKTGSKSSDIDQAQETEFSKIKDDDEEGESEDNNSRELTAEMRKRFARACDSMAPSMMEKFRAIQSGRPLDLHEIEEAFAEKASGTPQAPETPRQVGESQGTVSEVQSSMSLNFTRNCCAKRNQSEIVGYFGTTVCV